MLEQFIAKLLKELDIPQLPQNQDKAYVLQLKEDISILLSAVNQGVVMSAELAPYPKQFEDEFLEHIMYANLFSQGTGEGCVIGYNTKLDKLTLNTEIYNASHYEHFKLRLETFANYVDFWKESLREAQAKSTTPIFET